jgi:glycolate oxidase FAD binding subunit
VRVEEPRSAAEAADVLRSAAAEGQAVRFKGAGTKMEWGNPVPDPAVVVSTKILDRVVEHNAADLTAVLEAGVPLATAQKVFASSGQMLAIDPPLGESESATIGGVVATGDSGPLRHRYGGPRDLLLGMTVALSDGTVAKSGGKVIKNVAGYDLAKLFTGSFGTLGLIVQLAVRLHPLPRRRVTAMGFGDDPEAMQQAAVALAHSPFELESLDLAWHLWSGKLVARFAGAAPEAGAHEAVQLMAKSGLDADVEEEDDHLWEGQRDNQGNGEWTVVRVSALPSELARIVRIVIRLQGSMVARAGLGICWVWLPPLRPEGVVAAIDDLRFSLATFPCVVLDAPNEVREKVDVWGAEDGPEVELMRRVKVRFDPAGVCNPGVFLGGI